MIAVVQVTVGPLGKHRNVAADVGHHHGDGGARRIGGIVDIGDLDMARLEVDASSIRMLILLVTSSGSLAAASAWRTVPL